ncbi:hypothetical protein FB451DRAFT_1447020, partial [Mycena latifolia]
RRTHTRTYTRSTRRLVRHLHLRLGRGLARRGHGRLCRPHAMRISRIRPSAEARARPRRGGVPALAPAVRVQTRARGHHREHGRAAARARRWCALVPGRPRVRRRESEVESGRRGEGGGRGALHDEGRARTHIDHLLPLVLGRFGSVQVRGPFPRTPNLNLAVGSREPQTPNLNAGSGSVRRSNAFEPKPSPGTSAAKEKQAAFVALKDNALAATSLDELAKSFRELIVLIRDYRKSAPTTACLDALDAVQSRLDAHHEFPHEEETADSFSALLTKSVSAPIHVLTAQLQAQHQAIQSLSKSVDSIKTAHTLSKSYASATASTPGPTPSIVQPPKKPKSVPITSTPDERILLRCDGDVPPLFSLPYHELVPKINAYLAPLGLPNIVCASRSKDGGLFLVPDSKEAALHLEKAWSTWGPAGWYPLRGGTGP